MAYLPQFLSLDVRDRGFGEGGCGGIGGEGIGKEDVDNRGFSEGCSERATSSSSGAGALANKDQKMESAEQLVLDLNNLEFRENVLLELSEVYSHFHRCIFIF
ncbi:hypothetical protein P3S67_006510 [Capsicum chacoense]